MTIFFLLLEFQTSARVCPGTASVFFLFFSFLFNIAKIYCFVESPCTIIIPRYFLFLDILPSLWKAY